MKKNILLVATLLCVFRLFAQVDLAKLQQEYVSRKPALDTMRALPDVPFDSLRALNAEGISISFWWMPHEKQKGTALLVHGFMMNKSGMLSRAKLYYDLGYNVLVMDLRARGNSGGQTTTSGPEIRSDVMAVMDYYTNNLKEYGQLILIGYSHGGRAVVFAAEQKPDRVKSIILESIPYSLTESFRRTYKMDPPPIPEGDIAAAFRKISKIPILLMIGSNDSAIVPEEAQKIKDGFESPVSRLVIFENGGHDLSGQKYREIYLKSIRSFLNGPRLSPPPTP